MSRMLFKKNQQVECNECGKLTPYVVKKEKLHDDYERVFAECQNCSYQATIYYTDKNLRSLLARQRKLKDVSKKQELAERISSETDRLKRKLGDVSYV